MWNIQCVIVNRNRLYKGRLICWHSRPGVTNQQNQPNLTISQTLYEIKIKILS